ncbi:MAG: Nif3-like dinuclear metal center hexameric protein [Desulfomonilia bacterium]
MQKMVLKDVLKILDAIAPFETTEEWDSTGLMVGDPQQEIRSTLVALEPSLDVIDSACERGIDLIITHHPLVFQPLQRIDLSRVVSRKIAELIRHGISLVSMHTNLDKAQGGVADELARSLSLQNVKHFGMLRVGTTSAPVGLHAWVRTLPFRHVRIADASRAVQTVGFCPGSGMDSWMQALDLGCDTFLTGDVRYHAALDAKEAGMNVVDPGHFASEEIIVEPLSSRLREMLPGMDINVHHGVDVFEFITQKERED